MILNRAHDQPRNTLKSGDTWRRHHPGVHSSLRLQLVAHCASCGAPRRTNTGRCPACGGISRPAGSARTPAHVLEDIAWSQYLRGARDFTPEQLERLEAKAEARAKADPRFRLERLTAATRAQAAALREQIRTIERGMTTASAYSYGYQSDRAACHRKISKLELEIGTLNRQIIDLAKAMDVALQYGDVSRP